MDYTVLRRRKAEVKEVVSRDRKGPGDLEGQVFSRKMLPVFVKKRHPQGFGKQQGRIIPGPGGLDHQQPGISPVVHNHAAALPFYPVGVCRQLRGFQQGLPGNFGQWFLRPWESVRPFRARAFDLQGKGAQGLGRGTPGFFFALSQHRKQPVPGMVGEVGRGGFFDDAGQGVRGFFIQKISLALGRVLRTVQDAVQGVGSFRGDGIRRLREDILEIGHRHIGGDKIRAAAG